ncbi:hypothetical protein CRG98_000672 [Punica granatum]|uniref:Uncharacterized protein n=1 Tax=Punica granatum TaxID=22663 RepID=A0A2I0LE43_PUNGR|nr:hypothetical protein CRG98_000672 [Punica granatum]
MDPRRPKRLSALLHEVRPRGSMASLSPCRSPHLGSDPSSTMHARESGDFLFKSSRVITGIPGGFPVILAGFGLGTGWTKEIVGTLSPTEDRCPGGDLGTCDRGFFQCFPNVLKCSGIAVISVFCECAPKIHQEAFATIETSLGKPCRVPKGHLKLVPRPRWSLGACRLILGCRLLVSGSGPGGPRQKRRP